MSVSHILTTDQHHDEVATPCSEPKRPSWSYSRATIFRCVMVLEGVFLMVIGMTQPTCGQTDLEVFSPPPGSAVRLLEQSKSAIAVEDYSTAIEYLAPLLGLDADQQVMEDHFLPTRRRYATKSVRREAWKLIENLPARGRSVFELKYGIRARKKLSEAIADNDSSQLNEVASSYRHTQAGYVATLLLGKEQVFRGDFARACRYFQRVYDMEVPRRALNPELSIQYAIALTGAGRIDEAVEKILALKDEHPNLQYQFAGNILNHTVVDENSSRDFVLELSKNYPVKSRPDNSLAEREWLSYRSRGNLSVGKVDALLPLPEWSIGSATPKLPIEYRKLEKQRIAAREPILPVSHPVILKNSVVYRTADKVFAVDVKTGKRIWSYPWSHQNSELEKSDDEQSNQSAITHKLWLNSAQGRITSDGERIFFVKETKSVLESWSSPRRMLRQFERQRSANSLVCLQVVGPDGIAVEGQLAWAIDGQKKGTDFADAVFLGPPAIKDQTAYAIYEQGGQVHVAAIDTRSGDWIWTQQIASTRERDGFDDKRFRRSMAATPIFAEGLLICPTHVGGLVAIDLTDRTLKWGFKYPHLGDARLAQGLNNTGDSSFWYDDALFVIGDNLIFSPIECNDHFVIDIESGRTRRKQQKYNILMIAGQYEGNKVLLTNEALLVESPLGVGNFSLSFQYAPAGTGIFADQYFFLPAANRKLLQFDLKEQRVRVIETATQMGNLSYYSGRIISQSIYGIDSYWLKTPAQSKHKQTFQPNSTDAGVWLLHAQLLDQENNTEEATRAAMRSLQLASVDQTEEFLAGLMIKQLAAGGQLDWDLLEAGFRLLQNPNYKKRYLVSKIETQFSAGTNQRLLDDLMELVNLYSLSGRNQSTASQATEGALIELSDRHSVYGLRLVRSRLQNAVGQATDEQRKQYLNELQSRYRQALSTSETRRIRLMTELLADFGFIKAEINGLVDAFLKFGNGNDLIWVESLVFEFLAAEKDPTQRIVLVRRLADLKTKIYGESDQYSKSLLWKSYGSLIDSLPTNNETKKERDAAERWLRAQMEKLENSFTHQFPDGMTRIDQYQDADLDFFPLEAQDRKNASRLQSSTRLFPMPFQVELDNRGYFILRDTWGNLVFQDDSRTPGSRLTNQRFDITHYQVLGDLLVISCGYDHVALDLSRIASLQPENSDIESLSLLENEMLMGEQVEDKELATVWRFNALVPAGDPGNVRYGRDSNALDLVKSELLDATSGFVGKTANLSRNGYCLLTRGKLICLDPWSGQIVWERTGFRSGSDILGDDAFVYVVSADDRKVEVFDNRDGSAVSQLDVPAQMINRIYQNGSHIVSLRESQDREKGNDPTGNKLVVYGYQLQPEAIKNTWSYEFEQGTKADQVAPQTLAFLTPKGEFCLLDVASGEKRWQYKLQTGDQFSTLDVMPMGNDLVGEQLLVIANRNSRAQIETKRTDFAGPSRPVINVEGQVCLLNHKGPVWQSNAQIDGYDWVLNQPPSTPIFLFKKQDKRRKQTEIVFLRRTDGSLIQYTSPVKHFGATTNLRLHTKRNSFIFNMGYLWLELKLTDFPRPPEPPAQTGKFAGPRQPNPPTDEKKSKTGDPFIDSANDDPFASNRPTLKKWIEAEWAKNPMNRQSQRSADRP